MVNPVYELYRAVNLIKTIMKSKIDLNPPINSNEYLILVYNCINILFKTIACLFVNPQQLSPIEFVADIDYRIIYVLIFTIYQRILYINYCGYWHFHLFLFLHLNN